MINDWDYSIKDSAGDGGGVGGEQGVLYLQWLLEGMN